MSGIHDPEIYRAVLESMQTAVCVVDLENKILFWNDGAERITGYLRHEVLGRSCVENIQLHCNHTKCDACRERCPLFESMHNARPVEARAFLHHKAGHRTPVHIWAVPVRDARGSIIGAAQSFDRFSVSASGDQRPDDHCLDDTTGVANRAMMQAHLREALVTFMETRVPFAVLCLRLDELDTLRAKYGQEAAYSILRAAARTLESALRPADFVGRWDENQFLGILPGCNESALPSVRERVHKMIASDSVEWWGSELTAGAVSIETASPQMDDSVQTLVQRVQQMLADSPASAQTCPVPPADDQEGANR